MSKFTDRHFLKTDQYKDSSNLDARVELHKRFSTNPYGWLTWVFDRILKLPANAKVLELGCGPGYLWKDNASRLPSGWNITLSDLSAGMLDAAWRNLVVTGRSYRFKEIDAQDIPFEDETFDAVIANHMLYHIPDKQKALAEIRRVLKTGGRFFATTVGEKHMQEMNAWLDAVSGGQYVSKVVSSFLLENGMELLKPFFSQVTVSRYEDDLRVTELEPLLAYIRSAVPDSNLQEDKLEKLKLELQDELNRKGAIYISKDTGLFEAIK
jgi:ubiquinone/menaquinone biosynthesis C-methylase UbiE